jgi:hypothetical protein
LVPIAFDAELEPAAVLPDELHAATPAARASAAMAAARTLGFRDL